MQPAVHASSSSRGRVVGFYEDPVDSFSRPVTAAESWACYHFEMHARKCEHCHNPYEVHRNHEQLCDVGHGLAHDVARYLYQRSDGAIYSTTEEDNKLVRVEIPAGYVEVCSLLKAIEHSLRHRSRKPFVSVEVLPNTTPRTTIPVKYPTGMSSTFSVEERPPPLPKASRPVPSHGTAMTRKRPRDDKPTTSPAFNTTHTRGNTLRKREVSHLQYPRLVPGMNIDWPDLTEDIIEDVSSDSSYSTDSEAEDRLGKSEAVQYMNPRGSEYSINRDYDDNMSVTSSNEGSVFSISSLASSATDLSKGSGYSATQIATATRELLSIFRDDSALQPLYAKAIHGAIGPRKFVNAFRRLLKAFADRLKDEAQDRLDFLAARLVALKAREISEAILEIYQLGKAPELDVPEQRESAFTLPDDSSDEDEHEETNVDENIFEELTNIREFLIQSAAFKLLQADLQGYLSSKRRSKKPSIERQADLDPEEKTNGINGPQKPDSRTDAHARSTESAIENDCFEMLRHDRPLLELYLYAFRILGIDRFVDDFSDLLRHHYSNDHAALDREVDGSIDGSIDEQLITTWQPIASAIALRLEANLAFEKDDKCGTETDTSFLLELLSREGDDLKCPAPYDNLNRDLALLICRDPLRQLLSSVPKRAIDLSERNDTSLSNKTKAFLEDYTMAEWDWWPLAPRVPDIAYGECRLHWKFGGVQLYETLSSLECNIIRFAMPSLPDHPKQCFCCHLERPGKTSSATSPQSVDRTPEPQTKPWYSSLPMAWTKAAASTAASPSHSSTASQRYTPTDPSATSATGTNSAAAGGTSTNPSAINNSNSTPQITGQPATNPSIVVPDPSLRVLFGVQGSRWSLEVEQISTALLNDPAFFRELKTRYKKHRSWIKRLISPFRFRFCRFVKLEKFDTGRVLSQGDDLPDYPGVKDDYEYDPRPGTNPMISPKTFAVCLKACNMNCKWPWVNPWHDCVSLPCRSYRLGCIPKKKSEFDIQSDDAIAVAWGLEADHAISFAFMAVYHLVPLLAAFGFWIYWLIKFPGDWQNAAVPVLTVLAIFAVLWVPFGKHLGIV